MELQIVPILKTSCRVHIALQMHFTVVVVDLAFQERCAVMESLIALMEAMKRFENNFNCAKFQR